MKIFELKEILNNAIRHYSQFDSKDFIKLFVGNEYKRHIWDTPYLTFDNGAYEYCGVILPSIKDKRRSKNQTNKIIPIEQFNDEYENDDVATVGSIIKMLNTALNKIASIDDDFEIEMFATNDKLYIKTMPYLCVHDEEYRGGFAFLELNNVRIDDTDIDNKIIASLDADDIYDDDERQEEYDKRWAQYNKTHSLDFLQRESKQSISYSKLKKIIIDSI